MTNNSSKREFSMKRYDYFKFKDFNKNFSIFSNFLGFHDFLIFI